MAAPPPLHPARRQKQLNQLLACDRHRAALYGQADGQCVHFSVYGFGRRHFVNGDIIFAEDTFPRSIFLKDVEVFGNHLCQVSLNATTGSTERAGAQFNTGAYPIRTLSFKLKCKSYVPLYHLRPPVCPPASSVTVARGYETPVPLSRRHSGCVVLPRTGCREGVRFSARAPFVQAQGERGWTEGAHEGRPYTTLTHAGRRITLRMMASCALRAGGTATIYQEEMDAHTRRQ